MNSVVYFSPVITPEKVLELFKLADKKLPGKVAVKVHSGEKGNRNFLKPDFWKPVIDHVKGTVVECNTAYDGERNDTERHKKLLSYHGWADNFAVDLLDAEGPDIELPIPIDQACIDLVYACSAPGKPHLLERIESRNGVHTIKAAAEQGYGCREYKLIEVE